MKWRAVIMERKLKYQPDIAMSVICWSFTLMIFLTSMLLWLELTVLQPWTFSVLALFLVVAFVQLRSRIIVIRADQIEISKVIKANNDVIYYHNIVKVQLRRFGLVIKTDQDRYELLMRHKDAKEAADIIQHKRA